MTSASKKLSRKLNQRFAQKQNEMRRQPGIMGNGAGLLSVSGLDGFVYVLIGDRALPVFNNRVSPQIGVKVWVGYAPEEPNLFQVLSTRSETPAGVATGAIGYAPAKRYEWNAAGGGQDPLSVHLRAITQLKLSPSATGGLNVDLYRGYIYTGTAFLSITRRDIDLTVQVPSTSNKAALVLITIDNTGTVIQTKGSEVDIDALAVSDIPGIPDNTMWVSGAVRVYNGQTTIQEGRTNTDFVDLRYLNSSTTWGTIGGDITDQSDLQSSLAAIGNGTNPFEVQGILAVTTNAAIEWLVTGNTTISAWYIHVRTSGTASSTIVDINKNGTTIFTNQANRPTLAYDDVNDWAISGTPDFTTFVTGDVLTIDIDQIATGAADMTVIPDIAQTAAGLTVTDGTTTVDNTTEIEVANGAVTSPGTGQVVITVMPDIPSLHTAPSGTKTTTSATYEDFDGSTTELTITKLRADTDIIVEVGMSCYSTATNTGVTIGVAESGTDYNVGLFFINTADEHNFFTGLARVTGLAAGAHTFRLRWLRTSGSGTLISNADDMVTIKAQEVT